ncbi:MAG: DUF4136 domain-containing protein [Pseudomonadota bacterium]
MPIKHIVIAYVFSSRKGDARLLPSNTEDPEPVPPFQIFEVIVRRLLLALLFLTGLLSACGSAVYTDTDPSFDFAPLRTFTWAKNPPVVTSGDHQISPLAIAKMTTALKAEIERKGYRFVSSARRADFAVSYTLGARDKIELRHYPSTYTTSFRTWPWGARYYGFGYRSPFPQTREVEVTIGTLGVDAFDTRTRRPVFHAETSRRLSDAELAGTSDALILDAAETVLSEFPVRGQVPPAQ